MAELFISYAREDQATAERLAQALAPRGWRVWWDRHIPAGRRFDEVIAERLAAVDCVLALWSKAAIHSEWVVEEAETARERGVLVPAMIEEVEPPLGFRRIHAADLIGWDGATGHAGFDQLIDDIDAVLLRVATAAAIPAAMPSLGLLAPGQPEATADVAATGMIPPSAEPPIGVLAPAHGAAATAWDPQTIQLITQRLAQTVGPIARVIVARAMHEAADLTALLDLLGRTIPADDDRQSFVRDVTAAIHSRRGEDKPASLPGSASAPAMAGPWPAAAGGRHLPIAENSLGEIEKALARHIGPIAKVVLKRAVAQSGTADELCASLMTHIEREDDRRQFRAAVARLV